MKRLPAALLSVALFVTLGVGCQPAKKPAPETPPTPNTAPRITPAPKPVPARKPAMPTTPTDMDKLATKLSSEAAKVPGVKNAAVAISGSNAYVGLDLKANVTGQKTNEIKRDAANRVERADNRITNAYVSTDIDTVTRIKKVAQGISQGKPLSSFTAELTEISRRIVPSKSK